MTKYVLCGVSLALTALFAMSFSSPSTASVSSILKYLPQILMVFIGVGIDLSKYLFWHYRDIHRAYWVLAMALVVFSWMASLSFFVTQEQQQVSRTVENTAAFQAQRTAINLLEKEIRAKQSLLDARLASRYHDQWDKGEHLTGELAELRQELSRLIHETRTVGIDQARRDTSTSAFFLAIAQFLGTSFDSTVTAGYALLALLIELSALGIIALPDKKDTQCELGIAGGSKYRQVEDTQRENDQTTENALQEYVAPSLSQDEKIMIDIVSGETPPGLRKLIKKYGIQYQQARGILDRLLDSGIINKTGISYELVSKDVSKASSD